MHQTTMAVVCPLTSKLHPSWAHRLQLDSRRKKAEIMADQIRAVSMARFGGFIQQLSASEVLQLQSVFTQLSRMQRKVNASRRSVGVFAKSGRIPISVRAPKPQSPH